MAGEHNADDMTQLAKTVYVCCFDMFRKVNDEYGFERIGPSDCVLSHWVHAAIVEVPDLPSPKCSSHWSLGLYLAV
jgi:hypothetical protein